MNFDDIYSATDFGMSELYYDPYRPDIIANPYPVYARLRAEAPVYFNDEYDFYALSRYDDVRAGLLNHQALLSGRGGILEMIKNNAPMPPGTFICEDPPEHTGYRAVVQRIFAPRRMSALEQRIREITDACFDRIEGREEFDFIADIGAEIPMRVIGAMLGIPESDYAAVRHSVDDRLVTEAGKPMRLAGEMGIELDQSFGQYIDWRVDNPGDDVITELLSVEFTDAQGVQRRLTRDELLSFVNVLAGAGNETTNKLIGWTGKLLAEHPDQRRFLVNDPAAIPGAIEEILRFEPPGPHIARYVATDTVVRGQTIPAGSAVLLIVSSANRDEDVFENADRFDVRRRGPAHCSFGQGIHTCIGNVLARIEARVVIETLLRRIPEWDVDMDNARLLPTSTVRGWETMPAYINQRGFRALRERLQAAESGVEAPAPAVLDGRWTITVKGPTGAMPSELELATVDGVTGGQQSGEGMVNVIDRLDYDAASGDICWVNTIRKPMKMTLTFSGVVQGDRISGKVKAGFMGSWPFEGFKHAD